MGHGNIEELPAWARALVEDERVARLGLLDPGGAPRVLPVTYALHEGALWTAVDRKPKRDPEPARVRYLRRDPRAALTVDRYDDDWSTLAWVQVTGAVAIIDAAAAPAALDALAAKYPHYESEPPPGPLLCLKPDRFLWWSASG